MSDSAHLQTYWSDEEEEEIYMDSEDEEVLPKAYIPVMQLNVLQLRRPKCVDDSTGSSVVETKPYVYSELNNKHLSRPNTQTITTTIVKEEVSEEKPIVVAKPMSTSTPLQSTPAPMIAPKTVDQMPTFMSKPVDTIPAFYPLTAHLIQNPQKNSNQNPIFVANSLNTSTPSHPITAEAVVEKCVEQNCCSIQSKQMNGQFDQLLDNDLSQSTAFKQFYDYLVKAIDELDGNECLTTEEWNSKLESKFKTLVITNGAKDCDSMKRLQQMLTQFSGLIGEVVGRSSDPNSACFGQSVTVEDVMALKDEPSTADTFTQTDISGNIVIENIYT